MKNRIFMLKYNEALLKNQIRLEKQLKMVKEEIEKQQKTCNHVKVILGFHGSYPYRDAVEEMCLFCGEKVLDSYLPCIDAVYYKKTRYSNGAMEEQRLGRLQEIRDLWLQYANQNPTLHEDEILEKVKEDVRSDQEKINVLERKLNYTF